MPLIHTIEVSNLLNHGRLTPWRPDWRAERFLLGCHHAAINIPNGRGKSTMMLMLLAMLAGQRKTLNELMRTHGAPESTGTFTHFRIQTAHRTSGHDDLFQNLTNPSDGDEMVFGLYGNAVEGISFRFYAYIGTLDDCPISTMDGPNVKLINPNVFLERLRGQNSVFPANLKEQRDEEWKRYVAGHFDAASIMQQYAYQLANAAEGSSTYFDVKGKNKNYSAELFYKHLAPELLADVMGSHGEEDERGIEDTIHEKASSVVLALKKTRDAAKDLQDSELVLNAFVELDGKVQQIQAAKHELQITQKPLAEDLAVLEHAIMTEPVAGSPRRPDANEPDVYLCMVLQRGEWWITDQGLALLLNGSARAVNQHAAALGIPRNISHSVQKDHAIDFQGHLPQTNAARAPLDKLYNLEDAVQVCTQALHGQPAAAAQTLFDQLKSAFDWSRHRADTNPARHLLLEANRSIAALSAQNHGFKEEHEQVNLESIVLRDEETALKEDSSAWEVLNNSDLFTADELAHPQATGQTVLQEAQQANTDVDELNRTVSECNTIYKLWQAFHTEHGDDADAGKLAEALRDEITRVDEQLTIIKQAHAHAKGEERSLDQARDKARISAEDLQSRHGRVIANLDNAQRYAQWFQGEHPQGLDDDVVKELQAAQEELKTVTDGVSNLSGAVNAIAAFAAQHPDIAPSEWLADRVQQWKSLQAHKTTSQVSLNTIQALLDKSNERWPSAERYEHWFAGESTEGLEGRVVSAYQQADDRLGLNRESLESLQPALMAVAEFEGKYPDINPVAWLKDRRERGDAAKQLIARCVPQLETQESRRQIAIGKKVLAHAFDQYFAGENPYGLAGAVVEQLESAQVRRSDQIAALSRLQAELDAIANFETKISDITPAQWLSQWVQDCTRVRGELEAIDAELDQWVERRYFLDLDPLVPSRNAQLAAEIAGEYSQPLYAFVDTLDLTDVRKEAILTLFSALLFAPVVSDDTQAAAVARQMADANLEVPVLAGEALATFCRSESISYQDGVAQSWLVGVRTWSVECLLDPLLIEQERARLDAQIYIVRQKSEQLQHALHDLEAEEAFSHIARIAQDAIARGVPAHGVLLREQIATIDQALPRLLERASAKALATVEARMAFAAVLDVPPDSTWERLSDGLATMHSNIDMLDRQIREAESVLDLLAVDASEEATAIQAAKAMDDGVAHRAQALTDAIAELDLAMPGLMDRASIDARQAIRAMINLQGLFGLNGECTWASIEHAKAASEEARVNLQTELQKIDEGLMQLTRTVELEGLAREAADAIAKDVPAQHAVLVSLRTQCEQRLPRLEQRASPDAIVAIRAAWAIEKELDGQTLDDLSGAIISAHALQAKLAVDYASAWHTLEDLGNQLDQTNDRYRELHANQHRIEDLRQIQRFADDAVHGPHFMSEAPERLASLERSRERAQRRAAFKFDDAARFVLSGGMERITAIVQALALGAQRVTQINETLKKNDLEIKQLAEQTNSLHRCAQMIDESVIGIRRAYLERKKLLIQPVKIQPEKLKSIALYGWLYPSGDTPSEIAHSLAHAGAQLISDEAAELAERFKIAGSDLRHHDEAFTALIDKALTASHLKLPELARTQLQQARRDPTIVSKMLASTQESYAKNFDANAIAESHLSEARSGLSAWLTNFTLRLPDNLKTMKQIFAPQRDPITKAVVRAGFNIDAKTIDAEGVKSLIESIVQDVEAYESNEQAQKTTAREALRKTLRAEIRDNFYRKVIVNPRIQLVLPAISATPLEMERKMASSGQGIAITLLWILRLAEFVSEREIRRQTVGTAQRRRLRDKLTSFTIVDGAFSHLSDKGLIDETLKGIEESSGRFQLIVTAHDPAYQNDFSRFPALIVAREMQGHYMRAWSHLDKVESTDALGQHSIATFHTIRVARPNGHRSGADQ